MTQDRPSGGERRNGREAVRGAYLAVYAATYPRIKEMPDVRYGNGWWRVGPHLKYREGDFLKLIERQKAHLAASPPNNSGTDPGAKR